MITGANHIPGEGWSTAEKTTQDIDTVHEKLKQIAALQFSDFLLHDLRELCKSSNYEVLRNPLIDSVKVLKEHGLINADGSIDSTVRMVALSLIVGEGMSIHLMDPKAKL